MRRQPAWSSVLIGLGLTLGALDPARVSAQPSPGWTLVAEAAPGAPAHAVFVPARLREVVAAGEALDPAPVLVALHGLGDTGTKFAQPLLDQADAEGWIVLAPTLAYGDWRALSVAQDDIQLGEQVLAEVDRLQNEVGDVPVATDRVRLFGFSRGGQLAHRLGLVHPDRVTDVVVFSAGTYTLPEDAPREILPFGTADLAAYVGYPLDLDALRHVHFLVGVGLLDSNPEDLPRAWDPIEGSTRVQRAERFVRALRAEGVPADLRLFAGVGHDLTTSMVGAALGFLHDSPESDPSASDPET